jgi:hypothetical protein
VGFDVATFEPVATKSEEEIHKERDEKEKAWKEEKAALERIKIQSGDYTFHVHIIEGSTTIRFHGRENQAQSNLMFTHIILEIQTLV